MTDAPTTRETADHAELMDRIREVMDDCRCAEDGGIILGGSVAREHAADLENLLSEIAALRGERNRWHSAYEIAHDQATANGSAARQAERQRDELRDIGMSIYVYANDTLSGRIDGPDDREWQRACVVEVRNRARAFLVNQGVDQ